MLWNLSSTSWRSWGDKAPLILPVCVHVNYYSLEHGHRYTSLSRARSDSVASIMDASVKAGGDPLPSPNAFPVVPIVSSAHQKYLPRMYQLIPAIPQQQQQQRQRRVNDTGAILMNVLCLSHFCRRCCCIIALHAITEELITCPMTRSSACSLAHSLARAIELKSEH